VNSKIPIVTLAAAAVLVGCGQSGTQPPPSSATTQPPRPASAREADPCTFLPDSVVEKYKLYPGKLHEGEEVRSCMWPTESYAVGVYINWRADALVNFSEAYPVPGELTSLDGVKVVNKKGDARASCGILFFVEPGVVAQVVSGDEAPATADDACDRVKDVGTTVIGRMREQHLLDNAPAASPTTR
jgi:hypothetical protein